MVRIRETGNVSIHLSDLVPILEKKTTHGRAAFYRHPSLGRVLVLNGEIQHVEAWTPLYHEPLIHLPISFIEEPQTALILGGGSFFAAREILRYRSIRRVLMLDYDDALMDAVTGIYQEAASTRLDPRLEIRCVDAFSHIPCMDETFDLIINDAVDLANTADGFMMMTRLLTVDGVCSDVIYRHLFESAHLAKSIRLVPSLCSTVMSLIYVPEYPGLLHLLMMWGRSAALSQAQRNTHNNEQREWCRFSNRNPCSYFDPRFLGYYLHLPLCVRERINAARSEIGMFET